MKVILLGDFFKEVNAKNRLGKVPYGVVPHMAIYKGKGGGP